MTRDRGRERIRAVLMAQPRHPGTDDGLELKGIQVAPPPLFAAKHGQAPPLLIGSCFFTAYHAHPEPPLLEVEFHCGERPGLFNSQHPAQQFFPGHPVVYPASAAISIPRKCRENPFFPDAARYSAAAG